VAIDAAGNGWITNQGNSSLSVFTPSGAGTQTTANGLNMPSSLAIDAQGTIWVANSGNNSVTAVATSGVAVTGSTSYGAGGVNTPKAVAINPF
jgi:sugar lactone lactonase YvrE